MTRLDIELIASVIADLPRFPTKEQVGRAFGDALKFTRAHFNEEDFIAACGLVVKQKTAA